MIVLNMMGQDEVSGRLYLLPLFVPFVTKDSGECFTCQVEIMLHKNDHGMSAICCVPVDVSFRRRRRSFSVAQHAHQGTALWRGVFVALTLP
jgi:hypothetical protein